MSVKNLRLKTSVCSVLAMAAISGVAHSQEAALLEEIVVTAQKRSETVQDIALAVTAITSETRDIVGITSIQDLTDFTPGLTYSLTQDRISLRGVGRLSNNYGSDPGVATYADGFYTASTVEAGKRPILVERTEVLRGPQGTLYGRNSIGGAINVISKRPGDEFEGEVRVTAGSYKLGIMEAAFSGPMTDWLRYRVAGFKGQQGEGYFEDVDGVETEGGKYDDFYVEAQLEFNVGEAMDGWLKFSRAQWDQARRTLVTTTPYFIAPGFWSFSPCSTTPCSVLPTITSNPAALSPNATYNGGPSGAQLVSPPFTRQNPALSDLRKYDTDTPFRARLRDNHIFTLELVGHLGFADLKYVGGWQDYVYDQVSDFDGVDRTSYTYTPAFVPTPRTVYTRLEGFYKEAKEYYSHEINLISTSDSQLQWLAGVYYYFEDVYQDLGYRSPLQPELSAPTIAPFNPTAGPANPDRNLSIAGANLEASAIAGFGQIDWSFTDQWKLTVGARYTKDKKDAEEFRTRVIHDMPFILSGVADPQVVPNPNGYVFTAPFYSELNRTNKLSGEWDAVTGTAGVEWRPAQDMLLFGKYTRGYKSGGFNAGAFAGTAANNFREAYTDPEYVNAFEAGLKVTLFDRLTSNVSIFYYDYKNAQIPLDVRDPSSGLNVNTFFNFDKTESMGIELESVLAATDAWQVRLTYGFLKTEIKDDGCYIDSADTWNGTSPGGSWAPDHRSCPGVPGASQKIEGGDLPSAPEHKIALNTNYTWNTVAGDVTASATWTYRDEAYSSVFTREHYRVPSYDETDVRLLWKWPGDVLTLIAYANNVFDDVGYERASADQTVYQGNGVPGVPVVPGRIQQVGLTPPRTLGLEFQFRF